MKWQRIVQVSLSYFIFAFPNPDYFSREIIAIEMRRKNRKKKSETQKRKNNSTKANTFQMNRVSGVKISYNFRCHRLVPRDNCSIISLARR